MLIFYLILITFSVIVNYFDIMFFIVCEIVRKSSEMSYIDFKKHLKEKYSKINFETEIRKMMFGNKILYDVFFITLFYLKECPVYFIIPVIISFFELLFLPVDKIQKNLNKNKNRSLLLFLITKVFFLAIIIKTIIYLF